MNRIEAGLSELRNSFDNAGDPPAFLSKYHPLECLAHGHGTETFLVRAKADGARYVAKCYDKALFAVVNESVLLAGLHHEGLPEYVDSFENENVCITVRSYVEGTPLDVYAKKNRLTDRQAVDICIGLCDILGYLHAQTPPIIHRDIKPQNIIVKPDGKIALIDFDIARQYSDGAETDTQFFGTRVYAPPEQYGFSQTDCRTDIYSLGVLLRFLLTGAERAQAGKPVPAQARRIVERCTAFSPKDRYASVSEVKRALVRNDGQRKKRLLRAGALLLAALVFLCAGFMIGRYTTLLLRKTDTESLRFTEPLMEAAARARLGKAEGEPLTAEELLTIRELYVFGTEVSETGEAFEGGLSNGRVYECGSILSLDDLARMPNIERLQIAYQPLEDASGLAALKYPVYINLMHTRVSDVSVLAGKQTLEQLNQFDTDISDVSALASCKRLTFLEIGKTLVTSTDALSGLTALTVLSMKMMNLDSLNGIERFARLETLYLNETVVGSADALKKLPALKEVHVSGVATDQITALFSGTGVSVIAE